MDASGHRVVGALKGNSTRLVPSSGADGVQRQLDHHLHQQQAGCEAKREMFLDLQRRPSPGKFFHRSLSSAGSSSFATDLTASLRQYSPSAADNCNRLGADDELLADNDLPPFPPCCYTTAQQQQQHHHHQHQHQSQQQLGAQKVQVDAGIRSPGQSMMLTATMSAEHTRGGLTGDASPRGATHQQQQQQHYHHTQQLKRSAEGSLIHTQATNLHAFETMMSQSLENVGGEYRQPGLLCTPQNFALSSKYLGKNIFSYQGYL